VKTLGSLKGDFALDGELVALDSQGRASFQLLQNSLSQSLPIYFFAFDVVNKNGELLVNLAFHRRRQLLESFLTVPKDPVRLSPLLQAPSGQVLEAVRKLGLEGIVGKRIDSVYEPGERSGAWIKLRANMEQEFVVGGWRLHPRSARLRCVARGCLQRQRTHLRPQGEERICPADSGRDLPGP
jgi:bifunctional non-homologous end joining protein LigD